jgi:hypothetical protein
MNFLIKIKLKIMRKRIFLNCVIAAGFVVGLALMSGCEGPEGPAGPGRATGPAGTQGPAGPEGPAGADGSVTCLGCHSAEMPQIILEQFNQSVHSAGQIAVDYAGGRASCARCHSSEGFIEFARTGTVEENISSPSAWECKTCHGIHQSFEETDYALRLAEPINFIFDTTATTYDLGNSNLCANCHQSRRGEPNYESPGDEFDITSTHYGPHHGAQSNVLVGVGFAELEGTYSYPAPESASHNDADNGRCVGCHMADYGNGAGGHTWNPALDGCNTEACHNGALTDFNYNNVQTEIAALLEELRDLLVAQGVVEFVEVEHYELNPETGEIELVVVPEGYEPVVGVHTMVQAQAFFNWIGLEEDRSHGVHNPAYVKALLENSLEALQAAL